jgi:proline iminopeptidase
VDDHFGNGGSGHLDAAYLDDAYHVERPGADLYVEQVGPARAPLVYYLHGGPGYHAHGFRELLGDELEAYRLVYADQRGGGRSYADEPFDLGVLADDVAAVLQALALESVPWRAGVTLLAHGFGAAVAVRAAIRHPEVTRLVLVNPWFSMPMLARTLQRTAAMQSDRTDAALPPEAALAEPDAIDPEGLIDDAFSWVAAKQLLDRLQFPHPASRLRLEHADSTVLLGPTQTTELQRPWRIDVLAELPALGCDVVVLGGTLDGTAFPEQVEAGLTRLPQALSGLLEAGHYPWLDDPDGFLELLRAALPST